MSSTENILPHPPRRLEFRPADRGNSLKSPVRATYLTLILFTYLFLVPLVPGDQTKYYAVFLAVTFIIRALGMAEWTMPKSGAVQVFLIAESVALVSHFLEASSVVNVLSSVFIFSAVCQAVSGALSEGTFEQFEWKVFKLLLSAAALMFVFSTILTLVHYPTAPPNYFWQADASSGTRLLLMRGIRSTGGEVGHSDIIWVAIGIILLNEKFRRNLLWLSKEWFFHHGVLLLSVVVLIGTQARISLIIIFEAFLLFLYYRRLIGVRMISLVNVAIFAFYLCITFLPQVSVVVGDVVDQFQRELPGVRLGNGNSSQNDSLLSGREVLSAALVEEIGHHPLIGGGHDTPLLKYGVDKFGSIANGSEDLMASVESGLVVVVAYGWPFFILLLVFMAWPMIRALSNRSLDAGLSCTMSGAVFIAFITEGAFANWYGGSILLGLFVIIYSMDRPAANPS